MPASRVLACREMMDARNEVLVGRSGDYVVLRSGGWTVYLGIVKDGRFPEVERVIPNRSYAATVVHFAPSDVRFLEKSLRHLLAAKGFNSPVTLEANGAIAIRARASDLAPGTELMLSASRCAGEKVRLSVNREFLLRAARLGFCQLYATTPSAPLLWQDDHRQYVAAVLEPGAALASDDNLLRIKSPGAPRRGPPGVVKADPRRTRAQVTRGDSFPAHIGT